MTTVDYQLQMPYMVCKDQCHIWYARTNVNGCIAEENNYYNESNEYNNYDNVLEE